MSEENKATGNGLPQEGAEFVFGFVKKIIDKHGPRLPGSDEERAAQKDIAEEMEAATGVKPVVEPFKLAPRASIGAIPYCGIAAFFCCAGYYIHPLISLILGVLVLAFAVIQVFLYKGWFDKLFKQEVSNNTYSVIDGSDKVDYTIVFSGHTDSSWNWNMAVKHPLLMIPKTVYGIVGLLALIVLSVIRLILGQGAIVDTHLALTLIPLAFLPGFYFLSIYLSYDKTKASPGAMDNLSGVGLAMFMGKYFRENPSELPSNCRIICAALGSEEAGLKGSDAFCKAHAGDKELLPNCFVINLDSFRDYDNFDVIKGDAWQGTSFDPDLTELADKTYREVGVESHVIVNPVGGCDSTPFCKKGYKTITLAAQNPVATDYYHTYNDTYEGLNPKTLEKAVETLVSLTGKIHKLYAEQGYVFKDKKSK